MNWKVHLALLKFALLSLLMCLLLIVSLDFKIDRYLFNLVGTIVSGKRNLIINILIGIFTGCFVTVGSSLVGFISAIDEMMYMYKLNVGTALLLSRNISNLDEYEKHYDKVSSLNFQSKYDIPSISFWYPLNKKVEALIHASKLMVDITSTYISPQYMTYINNISEIKDLSAHEDTIIQIQRNKYSELSADIEIFRKSFFPQDANVFNFNRV